MRSGLILLALLMSFGVLMWRAWTLLREVRETSGWTTLGGHRIERQGTPFRFYYGLAVLVLLVPAFLIGIYAVIRQAWLTP
jgi:hypothetical protein